MNVTIALILGIGIGLFLAVFGLPVWKRAATTGAGKGMDMTPSPAEALRTPGKAQHRASDQYDRLR